MKICQGLVAALSYIRALDLSLNAENDLIGPAVTTSHLDKFSPSSEYRRPTTKKSTRTFFVGFSSNSKVGDPVLLSIDQLVVLALL